MIVQMRNPISVDLVRELASQLDDTTKLVTPDSPDYEQWIARWAVNAIKPAGAIAAPLKDSEISKLVKFASEYGLDLAVRGGGHSTGGTSSTAGGLVIDLSRMRQVIVDANAKVITAQGGALWEDVDYAAAAHGLAAVGGTVNHTGIGGLTLGGGLGWLTGQYGAVIDNLLAARVVIADGSILNTSKTENPDLFWAIRGAGHNFGVTVEFTFRAHEQPNEVYAGGIVFTSDKLPSIVDALNERLEHPDPKGAAMCVFAKPPQLPAAVVVVNLFYNGTEEQGKKYFASLFDLGPIVCEAKMMPYSGVNGMLNAMALPGGRRALKGTSFALPVSKDFMRELWDYYVNELEANPDMSETFIGAEFYDLTKVSSVPLDAASFANRGQYISGIVGISWTDPTKDEHNRAWGRGVLTKCRDWILKTHREPKSGQVIEYANYIEPGDSMEGKQYGANQDRLAHLKLKFDPKCLFDKTNVITPVAA